LSRQFNEDEDWIKALVDQYNQSELYEKMVRYYSIYLKKKELDGVRMSYP